MSIQRSSKKRGSESMLTKSEPKTRLVDDFDPDLPSDLKGIMSALQLIREKAQKDGQQKKEETISSVASEIRSKNDELKAKLEKERQTFAKALSKSSKECENCLKNEAARFQEIYEKFCKEKSAHLQALQGTISRFEEDKEMLFKKYEQLRKRETNIISENEKLCADKISQLEESLKKNKKGDKFVSIVKKTFDSILDDVSKEDLLADD
ncbi:hypothetical protein SLE2022_390490 [Rubroshorea leprosula]